MNDPQCINVYDSQSADYQHAFQVFLDHTDQKAKAREWLDRLVDGLPSRDLFIDAGAGNGKVTAWFTDPFQRTVAIEPNPYLCEELRHSCPTARVLPEAILTAEPPTGADLILCSHVLYYIPEAEWSAHLDRLASWLAPGGVLVVVLQNHETDCMRLLEQFHGRRFDLAALARRFEAERRSDYRVDLETVPARVVTPDFTAALTIAEFILNLLPMPDSPMRSDLEATVREHFTEPDGGFRLTCDQTFLQIRPRVRGA